MLGLRNEHGRSTLEMIIEMFVIITVAPLIVCCIVQGITTLTAIVLPWLVVALSVIGVAAALAVAFSARRGIGGVEAPPPDGGAPLLPPIRRPAGGSGSQGPGREGIR